MFSGIIQALGTVTKIEPESTGYRITVHEPKLSVSVADSVAVNGCCLTVVDKPAVGEFSFQAGPETLLRTNLGKLAPGGRVNLELALSLGDRLGGHFVSGHIDGLAELVRIDELGMYKDYYFSIPKNLAVQMASKGSVAVDGVSLTLVKTDADIFSVALIPYTLEVTTLGTLKIGDKANIETDILAKYVQRLIEAKDF